MSPEQHRAEEPGPNSDVYSFGVMCYEAIMGELPLGRFAEPQLAGEDALCGLIARALSVDRGQRPSMQDFVGVLNERRAPQLLLRMRVAEQGSRVLLRGPRSRGGPYGAGGAALSLPPQWSYLLFIVTVAAAILRFIETRIPHWRLPPWPFPLGGCVRHDCLGSPLVSAPGRASRVRLFGGWQSSHPFSISFGSWPRIHAVLPANEKESPRSAENRARQIRSTGSGQSFFEATLEKVEKERYLPAGRATSRPTTRS
jgi:serine/threonine protein kinase